MLNWILAFVYLPFWFLFVGLLLRYYSYADELFKLLSKQAPKYYKSIGEPRYEPAFNLFRNFRARDYLDKLTTRGIPKGFPKSDEARDMAQELRTQGRRLYFLFIMIFATFIIFAILDTMIR